MAIEPGAQRMGLTHFAISVGSVEAVDALTRKLRDARSIRTAIESKLRLEAGEEGCAIFDCLTV
jgi:hypothetical protein